MKCLFNTPRMRLGTGLSLTTLALLSACGGVSDNSPAAGDAQLRPAQAGELVRYVQAKARDRRVLRVNTPAGLPVLATLGEGAAAPVAGSVAASRIAQSGTTLQEQGVDEDDLIKTDGSTIVTLVRASSLEIGKPWARVQLHARRSDGGVDAPAALDLPPDPQAFGLAQGLFHVPALHRVAVLSESQLPYSFDICGGLPTCEFATLVPFRPVYVKNSVWLDLLDTATPGAPAFVERIRIDGRLLGSRRIGNSLVLVTQYTPQLGIEALPPDAPQAQSDALLAKLTVADVLPQIARTGAPVQPLLPETDCLLQPGNASIGIEITTITVFDLSSGSTARKSRCFVGGAEALYMAPTSLYLATTRWTYDPAQPVARFAPQMSTDIHKFALAAQAIDYRGSGEVPGHLGWDPAKKSYRMSEQGGDLRVVSFSGETGWFGGIVPNPTPTAPPSPATLSVLRESSADKQLKLIGQLPNSARPAPLGKPGEQVYAVRFLGTRGYVVTFRRSDPLYVLDLADPTDPKALGELQVEGFSDYLFPMSDSLLLGVGKDANASGVVGGVKVALFDIADPTQPRQIDAQGFGAAGSSSGLDHSSHGIDIFARGGVTRIALPLSLNMALAQPGARGLQRLEVNTQTRTLVAKTMIAAPAQAPHFDLSNDRAVQIEDHVYYFAAGLLGASSW